MSDDNKNGNGVAKKPKAFVTIALFEDHMQIITDLTDQKVIRQALKNAEESIVSAALAKASEQKPLITPIHTMPPVLRKSS